MIPTPIQVAGIVTSIARPEKILYSQTFRCMNSDCLFLCHKQNDDGGNASPYFTIRRLHQQLQLPLTNEEKRDPPMLCPACQHPSGLVEDETLRGEHLAQSIHLWVDFGLRAHWKVLLVMKEEHFLTPSHDLGCRVVVIGQLEERLVVGHAARMHRVLKACSLHRVPRVKLYAQLFFASALGSQRSVLGKIFGDQLFFFERLLVHLVVLSSMLHGKWSPGRTHHEEPQQRRTEEGPTTAIAEKLSVLFFGPVCEPLLQMMNNLPAFFEDRPTAVITCASTTPLVPHITPRPGNKNDWSLFEAGAAQYARDQLLLVPNLSALSAGDQVQLARVLERGVLSTKILEVPTIDCPLSSIAWCTVVCDAKFRQYRRGELALNKLWGSKVQPILSQSFDVVAFVEDDRDVSSVLEKRVPQFLTEESLLWLRSATGVAPPKLEPDSKRLLQSYFNAHRAKGSALTRKEIQRVMLVATLCARLLHAAQVEQFHCALAALVFETSRLWRGQPMLFDEGIAARSIASFDQFYQTFLEINQ